MRRGIGITIQIIADKTKSKDSKRIYVKSGHFRRSNTAGPRHSRTFRPRHATHGIGLSIQIPFVVGTGNEPVLGIPSNHPGATVIETEKCALDGRGTIFQHNRFGATAVLHFVLEDVAVVDTAVDQRNRRFFIILMSVAVHKMPTPSGNVPVDTGDGTVPVFCSADGTVDTLTAMEPVGRTEDGSKTEKEVWSHGRRGNRASRVE